MMPGIEQKPSKAECLKLERPCAKNKAGRRKVRKYLRSGRTRTDVQKQEFSEEKQNVTEREPLRCVLETKTTPKNNKSGENAKKKIPTESDRGGV